MWLACVALGESASDLSQKQRQKVQRDELRRERLRRGHANLGAGVRVNRALGLARGHAADHVADREAASAFLARLAERRQRVGRFPRLRDDDDQRVTIDDEVAIAVLRTVVDFDRKAGEALDQKLADERRMP